MPLLDHFTDPPLPRRRWTSFHAGWASNLAGSFNAVLPPGYFAQPEARFAIEIDVAAFREGDVNGPCADPWSSPAPLATVAFATETDVVEVRILSTRGGEVTLVGVVELVSPSNKDRPDDRTSFAARCASYLVGDRPRGRRCGDQVPGEPAR